jgi:hypothetical protein
MLRLQKSAVRNLTASTPSSCKRRQTVLEGTLPSHFKKTGFINRAPCGQRSARGEMMLQLRDQGVHDLQEKHVSPSDGTRTASVGTIYQAMPVVPFMIEVGKHHLSGSRKKKAFIPQHKAAGPSLAVSARHSMPNHGSLHSDSVLPCCFSPNHGIGNRGASAQHLLLWNIGIGHIRSTS